MALNGSKTAFCKQLASVISKYGRLSYVNRDNSVALVTKYGFVGMFDVKYAA